MTIEDKSTDALEQEASPPAKKKTFFRKKELELLIPDYLLMGFQEGVSKKDLLAFLRSKAEEIGNPEIVKIQILKKDGGFYWEIHDSGSGHGVLLDVLSALETKSSVVIKTSKKLIHVSKGKRGDGLAIAILTDDSNEIPTEGINFKDKMFNASSSGTGIVVFGAIFAFLGVISVFFALLFKFGILNKDESIKLPTGTIYPYEKMAEIERIMEDENLINSGVYAKKLSLSANKKGFVIRTGKEKVAVEQDSAAALKNELEKGSAE